MKKLSISRAAFVAAVTVGLSLVTAVRAADSDAADKTKSKLTANDKKFVRKAYKGGMAEVEAAKVAKEKAKSDSTKEAAEQMITDHSKANDELMEIAKEENLDLSKMPMTKPAAMTGTDFDKEYLTMQKNVHEKDIAMFEKEAADAKEGEDHDVPAFAKKTLPTLKKHLAMIDDALAKMK